MSNDNDYEAELVSLERELSAVECELQRLGRRQRELLERKDALKDKMDLQKSKNLGDKNWERSNFEWSEKLKKVAYESFGIVNFRPQQLSAMNASMSGHHAIVVMPTGAGKSLCFQLPAQLGEGITVVVSPLISLMEDQVMALTKIGLGAKLMSSASGKEETAAALNDLTDKNSPIKLLYVTPERFAKSKRFMAKLQKCYALGRLQRIAIDEVHCCSQWGHDFRPDYKFLGVLSSMFPDVPILGLTATATAKVLIDVQKMLDIRGTLVIKSTFNRPNLFYHIIEKPSSAEGCADIIHNLLGFRYKNQSGIIYAVSIKDCEDLTTALRSKGHKVASYHASLEPARRSAIHTKWVEKYYHVIIATVAFGMGIDKPDVRFVLHHSLSKAMESYYQESGRAGRDGSRAECVMMYRMQDVFRLSTMVFSSSGSLEHLYGMVKYCLDPTACRRRIISRHFDEEWGSNDCHEMCDRCCQSDVKKKDFLIAGFCKDIYKIIRWSAKQDVKVTAQKIIDSWFGKGASNLRVSDVKAPPLSRVQAENVIAFLLVNAYLKEDFHFTAYTTISYLKIGPSSDEIDRGTSSLKMISSKFLPLDVEHLAPTEMVLSCKKDEVKVESSNLNVSTVESNKKYESKITKNKGDGNKNTSNKLKLNTSKNNIRKIDSVPNHSSEPNNKKRKTFNTKINNDITDVIFIE